MTQLALPSPAVTADDVVVFGSDQGALAGFGIAKCLPVWSAQLGGAARKLREER